MKQFPNFTKYLLAFLCCFSLLIGRTTPVFSEETYVFERMWPTLQQPWYFVWVSDVDEDSLGNIYFSARNRIMKFTSDGKFITKWGENFGSIHSIAIDSYDNIYATYDTDHRIKKYTSDGQLVLEWESQNPAGISIDTSGDVYVADRENHRIHKYTSNGEFILEWGSQGSAEGQFFHPTGIAIDPSGNVYITDRGNNRIQKFSPDGQFLETWGQFGTGDGELCCPNGIDIDSDGNVYVTEGFYTETYCGCEENPSRLQKFSADGQFITKWGGYNVPLEQGAMHDPSGIMVSSSDIVFVTDFLSWCVLLFNRDGQLIDIWSPMNIGNGQYCSPQGIAVDNSGNSYVTDGHYIQKFDTEFQLIDTFTGNGKWDSPGAIDIDIEGNIYITYPYYIQKLDPDGQPLISWGGGENNDEYIFAQDIAVDINGSVYVSTNDNRIDKYKSVENGSGGYDYILDTQWGTEGTEPGQFKGVYGIDIDADGNIYTVDSGNGRIQKFSPEGNFLSEMVIGTGPTALMGIAIDIQGNIFISDWTDRIYKYSPEGQPIITWGTVGSDPGQLQYPDDLDIGPDGLLYVREYGNNRIQIFKKVEITNNNKAIIVSGGGAYQGNNLWDATQMSANYAYRTLTYQGFTKESIYYLTPDTDLDLDNNGEADDVDADATNANLQHAITGWASDAENVVLYLVDHGGEGTFRMSGTETLSATDLNTWLDQIQVTIPGKITVIYDACESGSFLSELAPPSGKERVVITSTSQGETAYFVSQGSVSFSNFFWTHIFNGLDIKDSFTLAKEAIGQIADCQHPLLDADGDGTGNETEDLILAEGAYIGNGTVIYGDVPVMGSVSEPQTINGTSSATLSAFNVTDDDGIARVWAVIRPPDYTQGSPDNPVQNLPSIDLLPVGGDQYEGTYDGFNIEGTYSIAIYARDRIGNTAVPLLTTVNVENPLRRRAIIVAGGSQSDDIWPAIENNTTLVYEALTFQGYSDDDIYFMSPVTFSTGVDGTATLSNLEYAINTWVQQSTQDLVLYMIGNGGYGTFELNVLETLSATQLDIWLDTLQGNICGKVTVIYDACRSGSFLEELTPPEGKERILISSSSSDEPAHFLSEGDICFSRFFWANIANGADVYDAFVVAKNAISFFCTGQTPHLDDNGNGIGNEKQDGLLSSYYSIGVGIMLAGDAPVIGSACPNQTLSGTSSGTIWVDNVTSTGDIDRVWAVITPPGYLINVAGRPVIDLPIVELVDEGNGLYEGTYSDFNIYGLYNITVYAKDTDGNISIPSETKVFQEEGLGAWKLISLQKQPENANIEAVLETLSDKVISVWAYVDGGWKVYDPENPGFSDLTTMEAGIGYWINIIEAGTLTVSGSPPSNSIDLTTGWNLVGYNSSTEQDIANALASIEGQYISVWAYIEGGWLVYDPENPGSSDLTTMEPGYGYWINASEACTWTLP
jgi:sugar lactone lactonase YvrE